MPRPVKWRRVGFAPEVTFFKPAGVPMRALEEVALSIEELEAIRLKDQEGLQQEECAQRMHISRPTFQRVLGSARSKIADALTGGKALRIEGGNFEMARRRFACSQDGHEWEVDFEEMVAEPSPVCPRCKSPDVRAVHPEGFGPGGRGRGRRFRHGWQDE